MSETTPTGEWAQPYAERLHFVEELTGFDWEHPDPVGAAAMEAWNAPFGAPEPTSATTEDRELPGPHGPIPVRIYRPAAGEPSGVGLVWYHGGAFIGGDLDMPEADLVARGLVTRTGGVVVSVFYRLCRDGVHHPVPHDDAYAAYRWTRDHAAELGIEAARLAVGGASAGGCLASTVALHGRDDGVPPVRALLAYPVAHGVIPEPSPALAALLPGIPVVLRFPPEATTGLNGNYLGSDPAAADGYAFAGHATDLRDYPPTYIENCEFDDLRASGESFARQLADAGVEVTVTTAAGLPHGHLNAIGSPLTSASLDRFAAQLLLPAADPAVR
ncbi:MAG: alpha/beta hydrolase [Propionicimonas sp.]|uniref:alpha/beta hydrolase n=1 Tax=Propionicimonas sp. TaxID=1955623 RepID=UPI003D0F2DE7